MAGSLGRAAALHGSRSHLLELSISRDLNVSQSEASNYVSYLQWWATSHPSHPQITRCRNWIDYCTWDFIQIRKLTEAIFNGGSPAIEVVMFM